MNGLNYLLQVNLYLTLFYGFYVLMLRNETFFKQNRIYLNLSVLLSFLIPFINSEWFRDLFVTRQVQETVSLTLIHETVFVTGGDAEGWTFAEALSYLYLTGAAILAIRFCIRLVMLRSALQPQKGSAFSFFKTLVVDPDLPGHKAIVDHEMVHIKQWHSLDVIFMELTSIVNWINPVVYFYKKEIKQIHEFIADEKAALSMENKSDYALLLFNNSLGISSGQLSNHFFNKSLLKRRIMMLDKSKSNKTALWKYGFSAPLFVLMLIFSAAAATSEDNALSVNSKQNVFDAVPPEVLKSSDNTVERAEVQTDVRLKVQAKREQVESNLAASAEIKSPEQSTLPDTLGNKNQLEGPPEFPGGMMGFSKYLAESIKYPAQAKAKNIQGRVIIGFVIKKDGTVDDVKLVRGIESSLDAEAIRVIKSSPKWKPGVVNGELMNVAYTLPVNFNFPPKPEAEKTN